MLRGTPSVRLSRAARRAPGRRVGAMALRAGSPARPDVAYDALRAALAAAEVVRREQLASHGQLVCTDFRINAAVAAAAAAMRAHPSHAFRDSPGLALLDAHGSLRLVTDLVHEDDALCLALACRALRDALWARFPQSKVFSEMSEDSQSEAESEAEFGSEKSPPAESPGHRLFRFCTRDAAVVATVPRLLWARDLRDRPDWLLGAEALPKSRCTEARSAKRSRGRAAWRRCSGRGPTAATGTRKRAARRRSAGTLP